MSLDVEILASTLLSLVQGDLQQALNTTCFPSFSPYFIDHADVAAGTITITPAGVAEFDLPVNVFVVDQSSLVANANGTPPGAKTPLGQATIVLQLTVSGTTLTLACTSVVLGPTFVGLLGPLAASLSAQIKAQIGTVGSVDLGPIFTQLGIPAPTSSAIVQVGGNLFIRFDPAGSPVDNLQSGQDWCLFVDSATLQTLAVSRINSILSTISRITSHTTATSWAPSGTVPHINVTVTGKLTVPDPLKGDFELDLGIDFGLQSLIPFPDKDLLEIVTWSFSISTGLFIVNNIIDSDISTYLNPTNFGGTALGPNKFSLSQSLPPLILGNAVFVYGSVTGLAAGMVLGGPVDGISVPDTSLVNFDVSQFPNDFLLIGFCRGGTVPPTPTAVTVTAVAGYSDAGKLCSVSILSPTSVDISPYLGSSPAPGTITESGIIAVTFNAVISMSVAHAGQPVEILVQTTRGVRVINFGTPPTPKLDAMGDVTNYTDITIDNCPIAVDPWFQVFHAYNPVWTPDPPPDWVDNIEQVAAFESSLITVTGVQTGELVTFTQPLDGGLSVINAGVLGAATVPALLAFRSLDEQATLMRADRAAIGTPAISGVLFQRVVTLDTPGAISHQLAGDGQRASVTTTFANGRSQTIVIDSLGIPILAGNQAVGVSNALRLKSKQIASGASASQQAPSAWTLDIPGLVKILSVPGFEGAPIAVAQMSNNTYLVLERQHDDKIRIAGLVPRWPDIPPVSGSWAISSSTGDRVAVFTVRSTTPESCRCDHDSSKPN
jgi:hypothetical protein